LLVHLDGKLVRAGFYATRVVSAKTAQQAEGSAIREVMTLPKLQDSMIHDPSNPPTFVVEKTEEISGSHPLEETPSGLAFYRME
jgi:hypothetical protein